MKKRKTLQYLLWLTAFIATVLFCYAPYGRMKPVLFLIFIFLVFIPQIVAITLQLYEIHEKFIGLSDECPDEHYHHTNIAPYYVKYISPNTNIFALMKAHGINPNRAGPVICT